MADAELTALLDRLATQPDAVPPSVMVREIAEAFGLTHVAYLGLHLPRITRSEPLVIVTYPADWVAHYKAQRYVEVDPAIHETARSVLPVDWGGLDRQSPRIRQLFGEAQDFGLGVHGVSIPIRGPHGELALFSVTSRLATREWESFRSRSMGHLQIVGHYLHAHVMRVQGAEPDPVRLGRQELETLKWASAGKTVADIATIMNISPRTVRFYMEIARHKLNSLNTSHAVAKAVSLRLIPPVY